MRPLLTKVGWGFVMYKHMAYIDYFIDSKKPLLRPRPVVVEEDYQLLCTVFPEPGFRSYFFGYIVSQLAKELKENGITTYTDRESRSQFSSITRFLSNIQLIRNETESNERRATTGENNESESGEGESADSSVSTSGNEERKQEREDDKETRPKSARSVIDSLRE